jgi:hypothetical protein
MRLWQNYLPLNKIKVLALGLLENKKAVKQMLYGS